MEQKVLYMILGMGIVTYLPRMFPLVILSKINMPPLVLNWLRYIPVAVLSALLVPSLLLSNDKLTIGINNNALLASFPCFLVAAKTKNLFLTVLAGMISMFILKLL